MNIVRYVYGIYQTLGKADETPPATDTAQSGLNGRLQRIAQRVTSLIASIDTANTSVASTNTKLDTVNTKLDTANTSVASTNTKLDVLNGKLDDIKSLLTDIKNKP